MLPSVRALSSGLGLLVAAAALTACTALGSGAGTDEETRSPTLAAEDARHTPLAALEARGAALHPRIAALHTPEGAPIVVVVETREESFAVTADLVRDPARGDLHELRAPRVMADIDPTLLLQPAVSP